MPKPIIHYEKVKDPKVLDEAIASCPTEVFVKEKGKVTVKNPKNCIGCRACEALCHNGEITVSDD
ncbi:4Fe-4S ferredoxin [archaeon]|nr:4Fe-4S ferredoxin [archaeon]